MTKAFFVTGASGFVGGELTRALVSDGLRVRALARSQGAAEKVAALGAEPVRGDLSSVEAIAAGARGCTHAIHCAALATEWGSLGEFEQANVIGTANALAGCSAAGVRRFIHVGTEAVHFAMRPLVRIHESEPLRPDSPVRYSATKARAEQLVRDANRPDFETLVVRPRLIWGRGDTTVLPSFVDAVRTGRFAWVDAGRHLISTAHIDNVVHGLRLASERGRGGEAYFITDEVHSVFRDFMTRLLATRGVTPPNRSFPRWLAGALAVTCETLWTFLPLPGTPPVTRLAYFLAANEVTIESDKARRELGYTPQVTIEQGIAELIMSTGQVMNACSSPEPP